MNRVVFVVGPTATGKSALALTLADEFGGRILNCDSLQACRRLDVGSAKPTAAERARVPHHLFDVVAPGQRLTAGDFRRLAHEVLAREPGPTFAVGGSGFYIQALEKGMFDVPAPDPAVEGAVRARIAAEGAAAAFAELTRRDPAHAARVGPEDIYRVGRALMVMDQTGRTVTELRESFRPEPFAYPKLKLGLTLSREDLAARVKRRTAEMIANGIVDETRALVDEGFGDWPALASVGYRECRRVIDGDLAPANLAAEIELKTLGLAKKQRTWFKRDPEIQWLDPGRALAQARELVRTFVDPPRGAQ